MDLAKGDICLVNFNPTKGKEIGKLRSAIIISKTQDNQMLDTVIVIPLSTCLVDEAWPYRIRIDKRERLERNSDACIYEIRALSKIRVKDKLATVSNDELVLIKQAITDVLF